MKQTVSGQAGFLVGYGRVDITPKELGVPLGGWGQTDKRLHNTVLDPIYASCVAITGTNGETLLLMSVDLVNSYAHDPIRKKIQQELGVPYDNILWAATHTHSAPDPYSPANSDYMKTVYENASQAAKLALDDQADATISIGRTQVEGLSYIRHFIMNDGTYAGANFGNMASGIKGYIAENDTSVQIIKFTRSGGKKDIIMVNAQGHPLITSGLTVPELSADVVGAARQQMEAQTDAHLIIFIGASGDVNMGTRLPRGDGKNREDHRAFGKMLSDCVLAALDTLEPIAAGAVRSAHHTYMGQVNRQMEDQLEDARRIQALYNRSDRDTGNVLARELGFSSVFHANGVIARSYIKEDQLPIGLTVFSFGEIAFAAGPYEMFTAHGRRIKEGSPYEMTFVASCGNGAVGYLPTEFAFQLGCYESHTSQFTGDTGSKCADILVALLRAMKAK